MKKSLAASLVVVALIVGLGIGYFLTPEYSSSAKAATSMGEGPWSIEKDRALIKGIIGHHTQALDIAKQAKNLSQKAEILGIADSILSGMPSKIEQLYAWKKDWYKDVSIVDPLTLPLGKAGEQFDLRFLNALINHHLEAIDMALMAQKGSTNEEIQNLLGIIITLDKADIEMFKNLRKNFYGI